MSSRIAAVCLAVLVAAALPPAASAAVDLTSVSLTPSTTQAGAHPNVEMALSVNQSPASEDLKSVRVVLPQGLVANPNAAVRCSSAALQDDACPAASTVGSVSVGAVVTVVPGVLEVPQTSPGTVYNLAPRPGEPARLGIVVRPEPVNSVELPKIVLEAPVSVGEATGYRLTTQFDDIPRTSGQFDIRVTDLEVTFQATASRGAFVTNPTACGLATMDVTVGAYDSPTPDSGSASFTPTGCGSLAFAPTLSGSLGGAGQTAAEASPRVSAVVSATPGHANVRGVSVTLPADIGIKVPLPSCPAADYAADTCPAAAHVGTARLDTPLLPLPLFGVVTLVQTAPGTLPQLAVRLAGSGVVVQLTGAVGLAEGRLVNVFDAIPDLPLTRFELTIRGGAGGILRNIDDLCRRAARTAAAASFSAHSGATNTSGAALPTRGCPPPPPVGSAQLRFREGRGTLRARVRARGSAPALRRVRLVLPRSLKLPRRPPLVSAYADGRRLGPRAVRLDRRRLTLAAAGARELALRWRGLRPRVTLPPRVRIAVRVTDTAGRVTQLVLRPRPAVSRR